MKHILNKEQKAAGLVTQEDDHTISIIDTKDNNKVIATFTAHTFTWQLQAFASEYLKERNK